MLIDTEAVMDFAWRISEARRRFFFTVTSWWRTPRSNAEVSGEADSAHLDGLAVDIVMDHVADRRALIRDLQTRGLHVREECDHLHVQRFPPEGKPAAGPSPNSRRSLPPEGGEGRGGIPLARADRRPIRSKRA